MNPESADMEMIPLPPLPFIPPTQAQRDAMIRWATQAVLAEREQAEQDAKRYRWLQDAVACGDTDIGVYKLSWSDSRGWLVGEQLDSSIDAAMRKEPETTKPAPT